jgi:hypothetical protein
MTITKDQLRLERKSQPDETGVVGNALLAPLVDEDYWEYRVIVGEHQAVVGFPKFGTVGVGFAVEEDWNTNLPFGGVVLDIWRHIANNKGDDSIPDELCIEAIRLIKEACILDGRRGRILDEQGTEVL